MTSPRTARDTPNRSAVLHLLGTTTQFRSARQLHADLLRERNSRLALSSVYRILHALTTEDLAEAQRAENGETLYRLRRTGGHHHYLVCRKCGYAVEFTDGDTEQIATTLGRRHDFTDLTHAVDIYGDCDRCARPN